MTSLKPCPFCGGEAYIRQVDDGKWHINTLRCGNGDISHHAYVIAGTKAEAIAAWNTRAADKPETFHDEFYDCESTVDAGEDSREKLDDEISGHITPMFSPGHGYVLANPQIVIGWLDRQAAITERECREYEDALREQHHKRIAELKAECDKLREKVRHQSRQLTDTQNALEKRNEEIKPRWKRDTEKLQSRIDALTAERDEWRARAAEEAANAEGHRRNASNIEEECGARARALDMQLKNIHNLEHERDELRRQVSELGELNDSLHARIEEAKEALS